MHKKIIVKYEAEHFNRVDLAARKVEQIYLSTIREAVQISTAISNLDPNRPFSFTDYPQTKERVKKLINGHYSAFSTILNESTKLEWLAAVEKKDEIAKSYLKAKFTEEQMLLRADRNLNALKSFQTRKENGLNLSDRVWNMSNQYKSELEMALDIGIGDGRSAADLSRDIRSYLNEPDKLFRRVRDKYGKLQLSNPAKSYSPGTGQYRSSYKNAMRLTRTEVNMAYRASDYEQNQHFDFVVGFEVVRSNHIFACSVCESLKGKYPKNFKFVGWHPHCRCHVIDILATESEFIQHQKKILSGDENAVLKSVNEITEPHKGFTNWIADNKDRIAGAKERGSLPYFLRDNADLINPRQKEPYVYSDSSFDKLRKIGVTVRTEQVTPFSYKINMGQFDLDEFNDELLSLCTGNDISLDEVYLINDLGKMKLSVYGNYKGDILKPFTMERSFRRSDGVISVSHDKLVVPDELQGKGLTKQLFRSLYKQYQKAEVETINVHANMEVGGYAWGRYGFCAERDEVRRLIIDFPTGIQNEVTKVVDDYFELNPNFEYFPMNVLANEKYKKYLLKRQWTGFLNLSDKTQRTIFEDYINK